MNVSLKFVIAALGVCNIGSAIGQELRFDIPAWTELEPLDAADARIKRFAFTARGVGGQEFAIPQSQNLFCVLNQEYNVLLNYYPEKDTWVFQVLLNPESQFAAGGIATCTSLSRLSTGGGQ